MPNTITRSKKDRWFYWHCDIENCGETARYLNKTAMYLGSQRHRDYHKENVSVRDEDGQS